MMKKESELKFTIGQLSDVKDKLREAEVHVKAYDMSTRFQKAEMQKYNQDNVPIKL